MLLCSFMQDEDSIIISGARQYSCYSGYSNDFRFEGDYGNDRSGPPPRVAAMDALYGMKMRQFEEGFIRRDLNKARLAFQDVHSLATGNWGCGAFGNDHLL